MTHDGCRLCKYEKEPEDSKRCMSCKQNFTDKYVRMTNADWIRSMTDEELADFLNECEDKGYMDDSITPKDGDGYNMDMLEWLKKEVED